MDIYLIIMKIQSSFPKEGKYLSSNSTKNNNTPDPKEITKKKSGVEAFLHKWGIPIAIIALVVIFLLPTPEGLSLEGKKALGIFLFALIMWVANTIPIYLTSIIVIMLLTFTNTFPEKDAMGTLGFQVIWLMVAAFVLTSAMIKSNLARRFALWMITSFGKTPKKTLFVLVVINFAIAFLIPSTTARATLLVPICMILLEVYRAVPGKSNLGRIMMLQGVQSDALATSGIMTATAGNVIAVGLINDIAGGNIGYMDWLVASMPLAMLTMLITFFVGLRLFSFKSETDKFEAVMNQLKKERNELGPMTLDEKKAGIIFLLAVVLWFTEKWHMAMFGFEISVYMVAVIAALLCLLPRVGLLEWKEANIKWDLMLFAAGAYAAGLAVEKNGSAEWVIGNLIDSLGLEHMNHFWVYAIVIFLTMYSHMIFTSKTVKVMIIVPAVIALAKTLGMNPVTLALAASFTITYTITLPPHSKVNAIYFSTGYFSVLDQLKYGIITCFIGASVITIAVFTWFRLLGYTP